MPMEDVITISAPVTDQRRALAFYTWLESMPAGCLRGVVFKFSDLQADYERLAAAGVDFDGPPFAGPDGTRQAVFHDPDGNTLVLEG